MDTEEWMIMVWICVEVYWIGLKLIDFYEWIYENCEISCIEYRYKWTMHMQNYSNLLNILVLDLE